MTADRPQGAVPSAVIDRRYSDLTSGGHKTTIRINTDRGHRVVTRPAAKLRSDTDVQGMFNTRTCFGRFLFGRGFVGGLIRWQQVGLRRAIQKIRARLEGTSTCLLTPAMY